MIKRTRIVLIWDRVSAENGELGIRFGDSFRDQAIAEQHELFDQTIGVF